METPLNISTEELVNRLLKPTEARVLHIKDTEESKNTIRPEDDPWWDQRGGRLVEATKLKETVKKQLAHVTSKLHTTTTARTMSSREKVVLEKPGATLAPVTKLSSPDAINPHKHVPSRLHRPTAATIHGEWRPKEEKKGVDLSKKTPDVSSRLLQAPIHTRTTKFVKEEDPLDVGGGWQKILPAGSGTKELVKSFEDIRPLPGENMTDKYMQYDDEQETGDIETEYATNGQHNGSPENRARSMSRGRREDGTRSRSRPRSASRPRDSNRVPTVEDLVGEADRTLPPAPNSARTPRPGAAATSGAPPVPPS
jgi:hypothetical protein